MHKEKISYARNYFQLSTLLILSLGLMAKTSSATDAFVTDSNAVSLMPDRFVEVSPGIYRGARPDQTALEDLSKLGVKTILNLDNDQDAIAFESAAAAKLGINWLSTPMSGFFAPSDEQVNKSLAILADTSLYPIYVHCQFGRDRTGLIVGLHRVFTEHWTPAAAHQEMIDRGFRTSLVFLDHYFEKRTGFDD